MYYILVTFLPRNDDEAQIFFKIFLKIFSSSNFEIFVLKLQYNFMSKLLEGSRSHHRQFMCYPVIMLMVDVGSNSGFD